MKRRIVLWASLVVLALGLAGPGLAQVFTATDPCAHRQQLVYDENLAVGIVTTTNDNTNLYVRYELIDYNPPAARFGTLHMWAGTDRTYLPVTASGYPNLAAFSGSLGGRIYDATGLTSYTFTIPLSELSIVDVRLSCGLPIFIVAHADVDMDGNPATTADIETSFAYGVPQMAGTPNWWYWIKHYICCDYGPPPPCGFDTVFAKGGWVWTTAPKSNPEGLPSLNLIKNRWGWAINLTVIGTYHFDIWAGAGLNDTSKGTLVGEATVNWTGSAVTVTYNMFGSYLLQEAHLYAGDNPPTTTAPGQYGYLDSFEPTGVTSYSFSNVPLADTNSDGVWLIIHGVTGIPCIR